MDSILELVFDIASSYFWLVVLLAGLLMIVGLQSLDRE